ncbi:unnamed protein product [Urochloa decumbens]|uniref:sterol 22-desaturase n=1 Tax=Urochloa decumbens TaxID=240449 RepID=A0ABC9AGY9_9POAL
MAVAAEESSFLGIIHAAAPFFVTAMALILLMEQVSYRRNKGPFPGPPLVVPFFGSIAQLIRDPTAYWDKLAARAKSSPLGLSADYFLGQFVVFIRDTELTHRVLANVRPDAFYFIGHPFGKKLFGEHNTVFVGPYLSATALEAFARDYNDFNVGLMAVPVDHPGLAFRRAKHAVARLDTVRELDDAAAAGDPPPPHTSDEEIGGHVFDFLFVAQDASTSSLCWAVLALAAHPDVLARVRAEVGALWSPCSGEPITTAQMAEMRYTQAVAREVVCYRPPATMVPHIAREAFPLAEGCYTVPKGATMFPSLYEASFQGFRDPAAFDPDRFFSEERREDVAFRRNILPFGAGAHQCVGQRYALNHLVLFMALFFVSIVDFRRHATEGCDDLVYIPTIAPKDDCTVYLEQRCTELPSF